MSHEGNKREQIEIEKKKKVLLQTRAKKLTFWPFASNRSFGFWGKKKAASFRFVFCFVLFFRGFFEFDKKVRCDEFATFGTFPIETKFLLCFDVSVVLFRLTCAFLRFVLQKKTKFDSEEENFEFLKSSLVSKSKNYN